MTVEEDLRESIRKNGLSQREKAYIKSMPERDKKRASTMIGWINDLLGLVAVHRPSHAPGFDRYTYVSVKDVLFRSAVVDGIVLLEMQDHHYKWHVLVEAYREPVSKEKVLAILCGETLPKPKLGFRKGGDA